jgi:hypothetical protein
MGAGDRTRKTPGSLARALAAFLFALTPAWASAQSVAPALALPVPGSITEPPPDLLDGTLSGLGDEEDDDAPKSSWLRFPSALQPYGEVDRLAPQVQLSKTIGRWRDPLVAVRGGDLPVWLD